MSPRQLGELFAHIIWRSLTRGGLTFAAPEDALEALAINRTLDLKQRIDAIDAPRSRSEPGGFPSCRQLCAAHSLRRSQIERVLPVIGVGLQDAGIAR